MTFNKILYTWMGLWFFMALLTLALVVSASTSDHGYGRYYRMDKEEAIASVTESFISNEAIELLTPEQTRALAQMYLDRIYTHRNWVETATMTLLSPGALRNVSLGINGGAIVLFLIKEGRDTYIQYLKKATKG